MNYKNITKEFLIEHYVIQKKNINEIARMLNLDGRGIWRYLVKFDIPRRKSGGANRKSLLKQRFGRLFVETETITETGFVVYHCKCDCGNKIDVRPAQLRSNKKSCGCSFNEAQSERQWKGVGKISGEYWTSLKNGAIKRLLPFSISIEYGWELFLEQNYKCAITSVDIEFSRNRKNNKDSQTASLDRKDNTKGYVIGNVWWVHKDINRMKSNFSYERFLELCELVYKNKVK